MATRNKEPEMEQEGQELGMLSGIDIAALKKALKEELMAELKAEEPEQGENPPVKKHTPDPYLEEYVEIQLFKDGKEYKDDVTVHVNGENCVIKRGVPVKIKRKFALVLEQAAKQNIKANEYAAEKQEDYKKQLQQYNI